MSGVDVLYVGAREWWYVIALLGGTFILLVIGVSVLAYISVTATKVCTVGSRFLNKFLIFGESVGVCDGQAGSAMLSPDVQVKG